MRVAGDGVDVVADVGADVVDGLRGEEEGVDCVADFAREVGEEGGGEGGVGGAGVGVDGGVDFGVEGVEVAGGGSLGCVGSGNGTYILFYVGEQAEVLF